MPGAPGLFRISWKIAGTRPCLRNWRGRVRRASAMRGSRLLAKIHMRRYCTAFGAAVFVNLNRWGDLEGEVANGPMGRGRDRMQTRWLAECKNLIPLYHYRDARIKATRKPLIAFHALRAHEHSTKQSAMTEPICAKDVTVRPSNE